jgi:hypothetical protein
LKNGCVEHGQIVRHLKAKHGLGHGYANLVATETLGGLAAPSEDDAVASQYAGAKAPLLPIYEEWRCGGIRSTLASASLVSASTSHPETRSAA